MQSEEKQLLRDNQLQDVDKHAIEWYTDINWLWTICGFGYYNIQNDFKVNISTCLRCLYFIFINILTIGCAVFNIYESIFIDDIDTLIIVILWILNVIPTWIYLHINLTYKCQKYHEHIQKICECIYQTQKYNQYIENNKFRCGCFVGLLLSSVLIINALALIPLCEGVQDNKIHLYEYGYSLIATWFNVCSMYCFDITLTYQCFLHITQFECFENKITTNDLNTVDQCKEEFKCITDSVKMTMTEWSLIASISFVTNVIRAVTVVALYLFDVSEHIESWCNTTLISFFLSFAMVCTRLIGVIYGPIVLNVSYFAIPNIAIHGLNDPNHCYVTRWYHDLMANPLRFQLLGINMNRTFCTALITSIIASFVASLIKTRLAAL